MLEWDIENRLFDSMRERLGGFLDSSEISMSPETIHSIHDLFSDIFMPNSQCMTNGMFKKPPKNLGDTYTRRGLFNVLPSTNATSQITDTLVVYCVGSDNLSDRLVDTIIAVSKYKFRNVIFFTSKWDVSVVTGKNFKRLQDLIEIRTGVTAEIDMQSGTFFCFILVSTCGISMIPVI